MEQQAFVLIQSGSCGLLNYSADNTNCQQEKLQPQSQQQIENCKNHKKKKCSKIKAKLNKIHEVCGDDEGRKIRTSSTSSGRSSSTTPSLSQQSTSSSSIAATNRYHKQQQHQQQSQQRNQQATNANVILSQNDFESEKLRIKEKIKIVRSKFAKINMKFNSGQQRPLDNFSEQEHKQLKQQQPSTSSSKSQQDPQEQQKNQKQQQQQNCFIQPPVPTSAPPLPRPAPFENEISFNTKKSRNRSQSERSSSSSSAIAIVNDSFKRNKKYPVQRSISETITATGNTRKNLLCDGGFELSVKNNTSATEAIGATEATSTKGEESNFLNHIEMDEEESKKSKRKRGRRHGKTLKDNSNRKVNDFYNLEIDSNSDFKLNSETLLILDLIAMPQEERDNFLIELAKVKKILIDNPSTGCIECNPKIAKLNSILYRGEVVWKMNNKVRDRIEAIANHKTSQPSPSSIPSLLSLKVDATSAKNDQAKRERARPLFEELVNTVVTEGLDAEQRKQFEMSLTSKKQRDNSRSYMYSVNFTKSLEAFAQKCSQAGLGVIIEGEIRVNAKNNDQAFIKHVYGEKDAMFTSQLIRKCALHGDIVRAFIRIKPNEGNNSNQKEATLNDSNGNTSIDQDQAENQNESTFNDSDAQVMDAIIVAGEEDDDEPLEVVPERSAKGFVIRLVKEIHNRRCVGSFLSYRLDSDYITFVPRDMKMPNIRIYRENWPVCFIEGNMANIQNVLYLAEVTDWVRDICIGKILQPVGKCGELESENYAILLQNNLTIIPYEDKFNEMFYGPIIITEEEKRLRKDLRSECIFTIDPLTARDLDDAMSCEPLSNGNYKIGVHISDVAYFLKENSELDDIVKRRTTSVYMVNEVFHMLPKPLCLKCSLLPGEDKFAFSVIWELTADGEIVNVQFHRTIINSCAQLAYEHAQKVIDYPDKEFTENDFPMIHNGYKISEIVEKIKCLHSISEKLRAKRFDNGALRINRPKLYFDLNPETGAPTNYGVCQLDSANYLIEEFMLLANQSVAKFIYEQFPKISILRRHEAPVSNVLKNLKERLSNVGMDLDISSSKALYSSFIKLTRQCGNVNSMEVILSHLVSKPMARAKYFCSDSVESEDDFWHYALSIPIYTHFTSPIRRYPDVLVHRVLCAALGYTPPPKRSPEELEKISNDCNDDKYNAKCAGDDSANLYFIHYVKSKKSILVRGAILELCKHAMEVILVETGQLVRVPYPKEGKDSARITLNNKTKPYTAQLVFTNAPELGTKELKMFAEVLIEIFVEKNKLKAKIAIPSVPKKVSLQTAATAIAISTVSGSSNDDDDNTTQKVLNPEGDTNSANRCKVELEQSGVNEVCSEQTGPENSSEQKLLQKCKRSSLNQTENHPSTSTASGHSTSNDDRTNAHSSTKEATPLNPVKTEPNKIKILSRDFVCSLRYEEVIKASSTTISSKNASNSITDTIPMVKVNKPLESLEPSLCTASTPKAETSSQCDDHNDSSDFKSTTIDSETQLSVDTSDDSLSWATPPTSPSMF